MDAYQITLNLNTNLLITILITQIVFFIISISVAVAVFSYKLSLIKKLHKDFLHEKQRKHTALIMLRQRKAQLEESKRFNGK